MAVHNEVDTGRSGSGLKANVPATIHVDRTGRSVSLEGTDRVTSKRQLVQIVALGNQSVVLRRNNLLTNEGIRDLGETPRLTNRVKQTDLRDLTVSNLLLLLSTPLPPDRRSRAAWMLPRARSTRTSVNASWVPSRTLPEPPANPNIMLHSLI